MAGLYRDRGIVLRSIKLGEADRIVTFLTEGRGKVRAVAKGIRKPKSRFGARLEPTSHVALQLYEGRNLDVIPGGFNVPRDRIDAMVARARGTIRGLRVPAPWQS